MFHLDFRNLVLWMLVCYVTLGHAGHLVTAQQCLQFCVDSAFESIGCTKYAWTCACNTDTFFTEANACLAECQDGPKDIRDIVNTACNIAGDQGNMVPFFADDLHQENPGSGALKVAPVLHRRALLKPIVDPTDTSTSSSSTTSSSQSSSRSSSSSSSSQTPSSSSSTTRSGSTTRSSSSTRTTSATGSASDSDSDTTATPKTTVSTSSESTPTTETASITTTSSLTTPTLSLISPILPSNTRPLSSGSIAQVPTAAPAGSATGIRVQGAFWVGITIVAGLVF